MKAQTELTDARYADLAEIVLAVAREIRIREFAAKPEIALTPSHASVMRYVDSNPGTTPSEAADATGLKRSNLSTTVRQLEASGLIERRDDPEDGRGVRLYPTEQAAATRAQIREQWTDLLKRAIGTEGGVDDATSLLTHLANELVAERRREGLRAGSRNL